MIIERVQHFDPILISRLFQASGTPIKEANENFFQSQDNILLTARSDAEYMGFLYAYVLQAVASVQPQVFLYSIDVFSRYQRQGVGRTLINELKAIADAKRCAEIFVLTNASNVAANHLYQQTGGVRENPDDVMYVYPLR